MRQPVGNAVEFGEAQPLITGDHRFVRGIERGECLEESGERRREIGDDRPAQLVLTDDQAPALAIYPGKFLIKTEIQLIGHRRVRLLCLCASPPYEALNFDGKALASRRLFPLHYLPGSRPVAGRAAYRPL